MFNVKLGSYLPSLDIHYIGFLISFKFQKLFNYAV